MTMGFYFVLEWKVKKGSFDESTLDNFKSSEVDGSPEEEGLAVNVRKKMIIGMIEKETSL